MEVVFPKETRDIHSHTVQTGSRTY